MRKGVSKARRFLARLEPLQGALTAYCRRLLWSAGDLEDALQETLVVAYRDFGHDEEGFRPRLFRVATLICFSFNRRRGRSGDREIREEEALEDAVEALERECTYEEILADPAVAFEGFGDELARACRRLTEKERAILLLKALGGLTCVEIAGVLDVPLGTAQGLLTRGRWKMRAALTDHARARERDASRRRPR